MIAVPPLPVIDQMTAFVVEQCHTALLADQKAAVQESFAQQSPAAQAGAPATARRHTMVETIGVRVCVRALAEAFPDRQGLELCLALTLAAEGWEEMFSTPGHLPQSLHRMAAFVAVDVLVLTLQGHTMPRAGALLAYWDARAGLFSRPEGAA